VELPYTYVDKVQGGPLHAAFTLNSAQIPSDGSHAGLWLGMGQFGKTWLQGGVEQSAGDTQPYAYIEAGVNGHQTHFDRFPVNYGQAVYVTLVPHPGTGHWSIMVNGHSFGTMPMSRWTLQSMLELQGGASALGTINGHIVKGSHP
jgi:hypothetical protein